MSKTAIASRPTGVMQRREGLCRMSDLRCVIFTPQMMRVTSPSMRPDGTACKRGSPRNGEPEPGSGSVASSVTRSRGLVMGTRPREEVLALPKLRQHLLDDLGGGHLFLGVRSASSQYPGDAEARE